MTTDMRGAVAQWTERRKFNPGSRVQVPPAQCADSSAGGAAVSKTAGRKFDSSSACEPCCGHKLLLPDCSGRSVRERLMVGRGRRQPAAWFRLILDTSAVGDDHIPIADPQVAGTVLGAVGRQTPGGPCFYARSVRRLRPPRYSMSSSAWSVSLLMQ